MDTRLIDPFPYERVVCLWKEPLCDITRARNCKGCGGRFIEW